mmetsp:Transcript_41973/g.58970  ORF Transcript_41973/g.58970 Transcript_41973/m.58970 type:complete len:274 (-) Transcript_41973:186-1007(-)|eukprot:CAMPEP_0202445206 /NCGR_PEP_ID=MMETSP1360-20130828/4075_1 /ASSEMBLY_ACC=CAM_ASM_000848 /TAXON_ID=515479 /ORGANISM="Licmophora paradoxa, Strain CCMP2313" /LENGTH=273 /DNA_ID=CAMNT_0049061391 /DNA_START=38 /DNA_END=859 /DNA_ORIENTATION=+
MISVRPALRAWSCRVTMLTTSSTKKAPTQLSTRFFSSETKSLTTIEEARQAIEEEKSLTQRKIEAMTKIDPFMVAGTTEPMPDPVLPDNPAEITALDPAHLRDAVMPDGTERLVHIRQGMQKVGQNPLTAEKEWLISFMDNGEAADTWDNSLMGWVSGADPMASNMELQMSFASAAEAVYFAKKRGWQFVVDEPRYRRGRSDDTTYADNFLPQSVAAKVKRDRTLCDHWERPLAGTSHYTRPLKYHGDGEVRQHGPNCEEKPAKDVPGYYKIR